MSSSSDRPSPLRWLLAPTVVGLAGCSDGALDGRGEGARLIAGGWWLMFWLGLAVFVLVFVLLGVALWKGRRSEPEADEGRVSRTLIIGGGIVLPALVIVLLVGVTLWMGDVLASEDEDALRVHIVGQQYWWSVEYPDHGVVTANEIHVPVDRDVQLTLESPDVIHSFWVPQLHGKIDLVPGRETRLRVRAETAGSFDGQCAEFCGIAHAHMRLQVHAQPADEFEEWLGEQAEPSREPETAAELEGRDVFLGSSCVYCHRVEGTNALSDFGPDLTHLASRETLAAGVLSNTRGNLAAWIIDPQRHKPGNQMPATVIPPEQLEPLLDYLESLE